MLWFFKLSAFRRDDINAGARKAGNIELSIFVLHFLTNFLTICYGCMEWCMFFNKGGAANRALLCQRADTSTLFDVGVAPLNEAVTNNTEFFRSRNSQVMKRSLKC